MMIDKITEILGKEAGPLLTHKCVTVGKDMLALPGSSGDNDIQQVVRTAVINKRAGGSGLITGRKAFQKTMKEGIQLLNAVQDVYLAGEVTIA